MSNDEKIQQEQQQEQQQPQESVKEEVADSEHTKTPIAITKSRYWQAVLWTENLIDDWKDRIDEQLQVPYAYCVHDKDTENDGVTPRKEHIHCIICFPNTTTYKHALNVFKQLGMNAVNTCEACRNIRWCYDYLIHDTDNAKKANKHLYEPTERICGNNFDIGFYEQISASEKMEMLIQLRNFIMQEGFTNVVDFTYATLEHVEYSSIHYQEVLMNNITKLDKYCAGNYKKGQTQIGSYNYQKRDTDYSTERDGEQDEPQTANFYTNPTQTAPQPHESTTALTCDNTTQPHESTTALTCDNTTLCCPYCGSIDFKKDGKTAAKTQRFFCKSCGTRFSEESHSFRHILPKTM